MEPGLKSNLVNNFFLRKLPAGMSTEIQPVFVIKKSIRSLHFVIN